MTGKLKSATSAKSGSGHSVWHAPHNSRFDALEALDLKPPTPDQVSAFRKAAHEETRVRAEAYRTPVTEETLRRSVR
jgi:hypothetical protein